jgi:ABC-type methionine transport system ATPase subunit
MREDVKVKKTIHFEFAQNLVKEPLLYQLTRQFDVVTNIRAASVTEEGGFVVLEMEGEEEVIDSALEYLRGMGIDASERGQ